MWRILQQEVAEDYVIATGVTTYIRDFVRFAFAEVGITLRFEGTEEQEVGIIDSINVQKYEKALNPNVEHRTTINDQPKIGKVVVRVDPQYYRPTEVDLLIGDPTKSKTQLGWVPQYDLAGLVKEMVASDLELARRL